MDRGYNYRFMLSHIAILRCISGHRAKCRLTTAPHLSANLRTSLKHEQKFNELFGKKQEKTGVFR